MKRGTPGTLTDAATGEVIRGKPGGDAVKRSRWRPEAQPAGEMNKTEAAFAALLDARQLAGEIDGYDFEPFKLRLGRDWKTTYRPDFAIYHVDGLIELAEVKGPAGYEDDARVKVKVAARLYPRFVFAGYVREDMKTVHFTRELFTK